MARADPIRHRAWLDGHKKRFPDKHKDWMIRSRYKTTLAAVEAKREEQEGCCAICGCDDRELVIDHDHVRDVFRGMLCRACNLLIGYAHENILVLDAAASYLNTTGSGDSSFFCASGHCPLFSEDALGTATIWGEARGEPQEGRIAVGEVICHRRDRRFFSDGKTVASVVLWPRQFSSWSESCKFRAEMAQLDDVDTTVQECMTAWQAAKLGKMDVSRGALMFYNPAIVTPSWEPYFVETAMIGNHRFGFMRKTA